MGSMLLTSLNKKKNFKYILLNNDIHESVGSQKTNVSKINFKYFFKSMGINEYLHISKKTDLSKINDVLKKKVIFCEVKTLKNKTNILNDLKHVKLKKVLLIRVVLIYIHIGYFKTGSTNLENNFFSIHNNINYLNIVDKNLLKLNILFKFFRPRISKQKKILANKIRN